MTPDPHPGRLTPRRSVWGRVGGRLHPDLLRRRLRELVPAPIRRADLATFRLVAQTRIPVVGRALPVLTRSANRSVLWLTIAAGLQLLGGNAGRRAALRGVLAIAATSTLTNLPAKLLTGRARPELDVVPEIRRLARVPSSTSFPSGHAASAFAFATAVGLEQPRLRVPLTGLASAVAFSRVYTGVHYPGDVVVGAAIGTAVAHATTRRWPLTDPGPAAADEATGGPRAAPDGRGLVVVANADAGNALGPEPADQLRSLLPGAEIMETEPDEDLLAALRRAAERAEVLGVAGGDGSANAAATVAAARGLPLALVPAGTLNHLATDLGVEEVAASARAVQEGRTIAMDLGEIDGHPFVNAASVGVYPHLVADREDLEGLIGKWPAAAWCMLRLLVTGRPYELEIDGHPRTVWLLFFGNGRYLRGGVAPTRRARLDDGDLDVRLVHAERPLARTRLVLSLVTGRLGRSKVYERWTAHEVRIRSRQGPLRLARDGESWQGPEELVVRKRPRALQVLQPAPVAPE
jgi:diacylglycerol kinase family enzyme/membrane-associated phospholipid phosphatase